MSPSSGPVVAFVKGVLIMADSARGKLGIVVGGGPAPGINGVISSVTIEAVNQGLEVVGIRDGFKPVNGDITHVRAHDPRCLPFYQKGGSLLALAGPTRPRTPHGNVLEG